MGDTVIVNIENQIQLRAKIIIQKQEMYYK